MTCIEAGRWRSSNDPRIDWSSFEAACQSEVPGYAGRKLGIEWMAEGVAIKMLESEVDPVELAVLSSYRPNWEVYTSMRMLTGGC